MKKLVIVLAAVVCVTLAAGQAQATLVGYWTFDETSGTTAHDSAGSNDGTVWGATWTSEGKVGGALNFDGIDNYVSAGTTERPTNTFSFGGWLKTLLTHETDIESTFDGSGISGQKYAFSPDHGGDLNAGAGLSVGINGISVYEHGSDYMPATAVYPADNIGDDWNHIMIVYDDKQPTIYLNGLLVHTGLTSPRETVYAPIQFGGMAYGFFDGIIDEVAIWNEALNAEAVRDVYLHGVPEPATIVLLGLGGLLLRRRKNNQLSADQKKQPRQLFVLPQCK